MDNTYTLSNGVLIPKIMLGTYSINGEDAKVMFKEAYKVGYRGFDCGRYYKNEGDWGEAIYTSEVDRKEIFIQTKVNYAEEKNGMDVIEDFEITLKHFHTDYIDALLIHWPVYNTFINTWHSLERLYAEGRVKSIGVCNFKPEHFTILEAEAKIMPMIVQFERHPCRKQPEIVAYCREKGIQMEAYSPLAVSNKRVANDRFLVELAQKYNCSVQQLALAWNISSGVIPLPRTKSVERLRLNMDSIQIHLSEQDIELINDYKTYFRALTEE